MQAVVAIHDNPVAAGQKERFITGKATGTTIVEASTGYVLPKQKNIVITRKAPPMFVKGITREYAPRTYAQRDRRFFTERVKPVSGLTQRADMRAWFLQQK